MRCPQSAPENCSHGRSNTETKGLFSGVDVGAVLLGSGMATSTGERIGESSGLDSLDSLDSLDAAGLLGFVAGERASRMRADANLLLAACAWADLHPVRPDEPGATMVEAWGDTGITLAGIGAPRVEEFAIPALAAKLGLRSEAGGRLVGEALELRHRLPRCWARVQAGQVEAWQARQVARATIAAGLSPVAAAFVDRHLSTVLGSIGLPTIGRCIDEAIARCMPDPDPRDPATPAGPDARRFVVDKRQVSFDGTLECHGVLDLADALAVEDAVAAEVDRLRALGATEAAGPLAAIALANLVTRLDATLDGDAEADETTKTAPARQASRRRRDRTVLLHLHLSAAAVTGCTCTDASVGRVEETRAPVTAEQVRAWCGAEATTHLRVLPVVDLDGRVHVEQYEVPDRLTTQARLTALTCVFPFCTRAALKSTHRDGSSGKGTGGTDGDHVIPRDHDVAAARAELRAAGVPEAELPEQPGPTDTLNLAPLCRSHHRLKTLAPARHRWELIQHDHGTWTWRAPGDHTHYLRDHTGTHVIPTWPPPSGDRAASADLSPPDGRDPPFDRLF